MGSFTSQSSYHHLTVVGGLEHFFMTFHSVGNVIIPIDELIFFTGVGIPPTSTAFVGFFTLSDCR